MNRMHPFLKENLQFVHKIPTILTVVGFITPFAYHYWVTQKLHIRDDDELALGVWMQVSDDDNIDKLMAENLGESFAVYESHARIERHPKDPRLVRAQINLLVCGEKNCGVIRAFAAMNTQEKRWHFKDLAICRSYNLSPRYRHLFNSKGVFYESKNFLKSIPYTIDKRRKFYEPIPYLYYFGIGCFSLFILKSLVPKMKPLTPIEIVRQARQKLPKDFPVRPS
eukprot:GEZU01005988.1.p1 GENE.GEZU01005988.1~~GEZU01005988.1.p1  ORF type:complete len:224 (-),score=37.91 GEZU01005988.1:77-748(-)